MPRYMMVPGGARMVILGMGRIGQDIARKAKAFNMEVICVTRAVPEIDRVVSREKWPKCFPPPMWSWLQCRSTPALRDF
jgi:lactate dehydrogenase-like 2-hydroxyacid dehydrogenase